MCGISCFSGNLIRESKIVQNVLWFYNHGVEKGALLTSVSDHILGNTLSSKHSPIVNEEIPLC